MILVTVGTHHQPFERLIRALETLPADELVVQHGHSSRPIGARESVAFLATGELLERMETADAVITHGGVGSVLMAIRCGHTPVVVPRLRRYLEHVDDHQVELTRALEREGKIAAVWDPDTLAQVVSATPPRTPARPPSDGPLHRAVRAALVGGHGAPSRSGPAPGILWRP